VILNKIKQEAIIDSPLNFLLINFYPNFITEITSKTIIPRTILINESLESIAWFEINSGDGGSPGFGASFCIFGPKLRERIDPSTIIKRIKTCFIVSHNPKCEVVFSNKPDGVLISPVTNKITTLNHAKIENFLAMLPISFPRSAGAITV